MDSTKEKVKLSDELLHHVAGGTADDLERAVDAMFIKYGVSDMDALMAVISDEDYRLLVAELNRQ